ncbi:MAG: vWA domain-containing protein [Verrucomicrobiales bacterium]|nr:TROVE domain-containing protein [Verrucomicrobiota bacterium JB025]
MANLNLFRSRRGPLATPANTRNDAGAPAYKLGDRAALARVAATGCLTPTFYANAGTQLDRVLELATKVDTDFLARTALYSRRRGFMKDMPALLCAVLATRDLDRLAEVFPQVIDNGRMLRTFVQILRSGVTGRKSLGSAPKRLIRQWLENATDRDLVNAAIGNAPSLADIVKMVHPRPQSDAREAFYGWLLGRAYRADLLPEALRDFEAWKLSRQGEIPAVPFQMLTARNLGQREWSEIAENASWQTTRMNLNTFARHGVFRDRAMVDRIAAKLADPARVRRARVFPYQLLAAYLNTGKDVPNKVRDALQDALEAALSAVPKISGKVVVCPDVSGSMQWPVTGWQPGASSAVRCIDVAALVAAAFLRANRQTEVLPFENEVVETRLNPRDSVMTNASRLAAIGGGGTNCSAPLARLNRQRIAPDLVIFVSDNESWIDARAGRRHGTRMLNEWNAIRQRNPNAKLVCLDIVPNTTSQAPDREDILNIGGFSDAVFKVIASFAAGSAGEDRWIREIDNEHLKPRAMSA